MDAEVEDQFRSPSPKSNQEHDGSPTPRCKSKRKRKDVPGISGETSQPQKTFNTRSNVWENFTRKKNNRDSCICNYCHKSFSCPTKSGTSNLGKHMKICEPFLRWKESASYMVITVHFIDEFWKLQKYIMGFKYVTDHKCQTIATVLLECLAEWGIEKLFCITTDNATANTTALMKFQRSFSSQSPDSFVLDGEFMHVRCCGHIINLIVRDGLAKIDVNVCAIRNAISYVIASTTRLRSFELRVDSGKMSRGSLPLDCKTRWNSTYSMLTKALKYKLAFNKMEAEDKLYNDYFLEVENGNKRVGPPCKSDWDAVERLVRFMVMFYNSTMIVSASSTLNSYKCYGEIVTLEKNLKTLCTSLDLVLKDKAEKMLEKFDKYWDGMKNINKMLVVASVFDPRKKMQFARMCFEKLYGKDSPDAKEMNQSVLGVLYSLFKEYSDRYGTSQSVQTSQSTQTSSFGSQEQSAVRMDLVDYDFAYERMDFMYKEIVDELVVQDSKDELETYLTETVENPKTMAGTEHNILSWWNANNRKYPILSEIARDVLAMQGSSVASESAFSNSGRIIEPYRSCLTHYMVEVLVCSEQWMKSDIERSMEAKDSKLVTMEEIQAEYEFEDKLKRDFETLKIIED